MPSFAPSASLFIVLGSLVLAGCGPAQRPAPVVPLAPALAVPVAGQDPSPEVPAAGLNDREPDTCKAADHVALLGQPTRAVALSGIAKPTRIVAPGMIVDQEEYDSMRVNFHLNDAGVVVRINCG